MAGIYTGMLSQSSLLNVPVLRDVDVLVIGSTCAAVAAALEARRAGRSVLVTGDLSYLGSDLAGTLRLWPGESRLEDPLLQAAFGGSAPLPARPLAIKRAMEGALMEAAIPFLFCCRPVALLRGGHGEIAGAVLAARTALMAVTCRAIVDASENGIVARLAGVPLHPREGEQGWVEWNVLGDEPPADWPGETLEIFPSFFQKRKKEGDTTYRAFRLAIGRSALGGDRLAAAHIARSLLLDDNVLVTADLLSFPPSESIAAAGGLRTDGENPGAAQVQPGLWLLNGLLPFPLQTLEALRLPERAVAFGRAVGAAAAASAKQGQPEANGFEVQCAGGAAGAFRFASVFLRGGRRSLALGGWAFPALGRYDVVVAGGGTGGAPAGIAAARAGASALVLEAQPGLGGIGTQGIISMYYFGHRVGFTAELDEAVNRYDRFSREHEGRTWTPEIKSRVYHRMLREAGGRAWTGGFAFGVKAEGTRVAGLLVSTPFGCGLVEAGCVVDASGSADIASAAGAPCRVVDARHAAVQGAGLSSRIHPQVRYQNSDHQFIDDSDPEGVTAAFVQARAKYPDDFDTIGMIDSRERRQIIGDIEVSPLDLLARRTFPDTLFCACSNFDTHGFTVHPVFMMVPPDHDPIFAHVPFRCMLPRGVDGVIVTGLGMSAHRDALPLLRMQADVQNQGYAAGLAAAESVRAGVPLRAIDLPSLQRKLAGLGILDAKVLEHRDSFPMSREAVCEAAGGDLGKLINIAILMAHPDECREPLLAVLADDPDPQRRRDAARILGMMGESAAAPVLEEIVCTTAWDEGWNYRGMGQFGRSMSWLDSAVIALGKTQCASAAGVLEAKIDVLDGDAAFSHCRAVALAAAMIADPRLAAALARLLEKPGMSGHAITSLQALHDSATGDPIETAPRNLALRELYLAMGLFLAGDVRGRGREILETYARDLRGVFARHASALLADGDHAALRLQIA